jgi:hypothetical protein
MAAAEERRGIEIRDCVGEISMHDKVDVLIIGSLGRGGGVESCRYQDADPLPGAGRLGEAKGHVVEQGDWSLLDPVRARPPMYRVVE